MAQTEICDNGIDDDGDGLIDCYDADCSGVMDCEGFFFGQPEPDCGFTPPPLEAIELNLLFKTDETRFPIDQRAGVFIGDMNNDGVPDLVSRDNGPPRIQVFSGDDGRILQSIVTPSTHPFGQTAIADVDGDGLGDMFHVEYSGRLARYEFGNPNAVWRTANFVGDDNVVSSPQLADINQDGRPEVYVGDRIFDALTGIRYVDGNGAVNVGGYAGGSNSDRFPLYFDLYQPGDPKPGGGVFGPEANGLEYIAGHQVFTVDFTSGAANSGGFQLAAQYSGPTNNRDGFTSIADINGDGRMDIAVMDAGRVYAWDPYTNQRIGPDFDVPNTSSGGRINIGDFDGDGDVELGFAGRNIYIVRQYNDPTPNDGNPNNGTWSDLWRKTGLDDGSQRTGSTLFDFDGDGKVEVVYSEEEDLFIYDGETGDELFRTTSRSGTRTEYPLIADVNGDGTAEIIVTAQEKNGPQFSGTGWVSVYESANQPWVPARQVWNQHGYNVVNVNDDLTIPQFQQDPLNPALGNRYNNFLVQTALGGGVNSNVIYPAPDAIIMAETDGNGDPIIDFSDCPNTITINLQVDNAGSAPLPASTPISFYDGDPSATAANLIVTTVLGTQVDTGAAVIVPVTVDVSNVPAGSPVWLSVNDPGFAAADLPFQPEDFPLTGTAECDYTNNVSNVGNVRCGEVCDNGNDDDGDGLIDEPNLTQTDDTGCPGEMLPAIITDVAGGTWSVLGGSSIGTTVNNNGVVTLGNNFTGSPVTETIRYDDGICTEEVTVTTVDDENPEIACPGNQTVMADANCTALPSDYSGQTQLSDNCTAVSEINLVQDAPAAFSLGPNPVMMTATDQSGNQVSCTFMVTVEDRSAPTITNCPPDANVPLDANCNYIVPNLTAGVNATDNCTTPANIIWAQTPVQSSVRSNDGSTVLVTLTATDQAGNTDNCTYTLTLEDVTPPTIQCPGFQDRTLSFTNCTLSLEDFRGQVQRQDNCSFNGQINITQSPAPGTTISSPGQTTITMTGTDAAGNSSNCTFTYEAFDRDPPQLVCPPSRQAMVDPVSCANIVPDLTVETQITDNCGAANLASVTQSPAAGSTFTGFFQNVTVTATDASGNANICQTTLLPGTPPPPTIACPADQQLVADSNCSAVVPDYTSQATIMGCGTSTLSQQPTPGTSISANTSITLTARNGSGTPVSCSFQATIVDQTPPTINCPATQTIAVDGTCAVPLPDYTAAASTQDNCSPSRGNVTVTQSPAAGTMYDINDNSVTVTLTVTDVAGNQSTCNFQVQLLDNQPPMISCPVSPQTDPLDGDCEASIPDFRTATMVSSTCTMSGFTLQQVPAPGTVVSGEQIVSITITATDQAGNSVDCSFDYETEDVTSPTVFCPANRTEEVDGDCEFVLPDYTGLANIADNCSSLAPAPAPNLTVTQSPAPGTTLSGHGTVQTITITATDAAGNVTSCDFDLTLEDVTDPMVTCPPAQNRQLDANCDYTLEDFLPLSSATDNCNNATNITLSQQPQAGLIGYIGPSTQTVTISAQDQAGNRDDCSFLLSITDATPPTITCPPSPVLNVDASCMATVPDLTNDALAADNCDNGIPPTVTQDIPVGTILSGDGTTQNVVLTATDNSGLTANCTVTITLADEAPPSVICPAAQDLNLNPTGCSVALPDLSGQLTLNDNCTANNALTIQQMPGAGTTLNGANTVQTVTFTVDDGNGNSANCSVDVTLKDVTDPTITCPSPAPLPLDQNCKAVLPDYTGQATANDDCTMSAGITLTQSPAAGTELSFDGEQITVTITVGDGNGNTASCSFPITAEDQEAPSIACPPDRDEAVSAGCDFTLPNYTAEATLSDNCSEATGITVTQSPAPGTVIPQAQLDQPQTITLTAEDQAGNTMTCTFAITPVDETNPSIVCPGPQTILLDAAGCEATLGDLTGLATVMDNCSNPANINISQDSAATNTYPGLVPPRITVVLTATDEAGNTASCPITVSIEDQVNPTVDCSAADQTVALDGDCNGQIPDLIPDLVTNDNCSATALTIDQSPAPGANYGGDGTVVNVTFTVSDASGNTVTCMSQVTFEDQSPPIPTTCPTDQTLDVDDNCPFPLPDYTGSVTVADNCRAQADIILTQVPAPGTTVMGPGSVIPITITSDDGNGNTNSCTFDVTLQDNTGVQLTCPGDQLIIASSDDCDALLPDYTGEVVTSDNCAAFPAGGSVTQSPVPGTLLPPDSLDRPQTITITVNDGNGNITMCEITATMVDTLAPTIVCPADFTDAVDEACGFALDDYRGLATATDNCAAMGQITLTQDPPIGGGLTGPDATQTITLTATDPSGNAANCTFVLTIQDTLPPVIICPEPDTLLTNGDCEIVIGDYRGQATSQDNCTEASALTLVQSPAPGTVISGHLTTQVVTITATDGSGNSASCDFPVTAKDETPPTVTCPGDQIIRPDANCEALIPDYRSLATPEDNCTTAANITLTQRPAPGTMLNGQGASQTITIVADDGNGNLDSCQFQVVLEDNVVPQIACPADKAVEVDGNCEYAVEDFTLQATATDNCTAVADLDLTQNIGIGTTVSGDGNSVTVTVTADDGNGNTAQCTTTVSLEDTEDPSIICPANQLINVDTGCEALVPDYRGDAVLMDNCTSDQAINVSQVLAPGTALSSHNTLRTITLTADDGNGNTADCSFTLQLKDVTPPTIDCPANQEIFVDGSCETVLPDYRPQSIALDNCNMAPATAQNNAPGTPISGLGTQTVTLTADDGNGNTSSCDFTVTVSDQTPPELVCPPRSVVAADANCVVTLADYRDSIMVTDNCTNNMALAQVQSPVVGAMFSGLNATQAVSITVTDASGNVSNCVITVELIDTLRPNIVCPNDTTLAVDEDCGAIIPDYTALAETMDNCNAPSAITVTQSPVAGTMVSDEASLITVTLTATDASGNSVSCDFAVQLIDSLPPAIICPADDLISVDGDCEILLPDYRPSAGPTDNCSAPAAILLEQRPAPGTPLSGDGTTQEVTIIATDESGNQDSCKLTVTLEDSTDPMITCPTDQELTADDDCEVVIPDYTASATASSACDQSNITITQMPPLGTTISDHSTSQLITLTATDASGNSISCSFTVTLLDREAPVITDCQTDTIGIVDANCRYVLPDYWASSPVTAADNCRPSGIAATTATGDQISYTQSPAAGTILMDAFTTQIITLTADDGNGNTVSCDFELTLRDTISPTIVCPGDTIANPDTGCDFTLEDYRERAVIGDNCTATDDLVVVQSPATGTVISGQATSQEITLTVTDASGNSTDCSFLLMLQDTISPSIDCPLDKVGNLDTNCAFTVPDYRGEVVMADNCTAAAAIVITQVPAPTTVINNLNENGTVTITLTADDGNGNTSSCDFTVTLDDVIDPVLNCVADSTVFVDASCMAVLPDLVAGSSATDNCGTPVITQSPLAATVYSGDDTVIPVTLTADDGNGNMSQCIVTVTLQDTIRPTIDCPANETLFTDGDCEVAIPDYRLRATVADNCMTSGDIIVSQSPVPGTVLNGDGSSQTITLTADDGNGNTQSCTFVLSLEDNTPPTIDCPPTQTQFADAGCDIRVDDYTGLAVVADNCTAAGAVTVTQNPPAETMLSGVQSQLITLTADDGNGNTTDCQFLLELDDNSEPRVVCPPAQEIDFADGCAFTLPDYRNLALPDDNCNTGNLTLTQSPSIDTLLNDLGTSVEVTITVTDDSGNQGNCSFTVTTVSPTPPPAVDTIELAVIEAPTGSGTVSLLDAFDPQAISNLSGRDLDAGQDPDIAPYTVSFFRSETNAVNESGGLPATGYDPVSTEDTVVVRVEDPATGCFTLSRIIFAPRTPGTSAALDLVHCNRTPFTLVIDGLPQPGGANTTIVRHEWRIISTGTTRLTAAQLSGADTQVISVDTEPLRSGTFVLEYQFFEDYGNGALVPSTPKRIRVVVENVGAGKFFWDGRE